MRRGEREIRDQAEVLAIMTEALVCRLGFSDNGTPYVVPMNFGLGEGCIYLHCAKEGRKLDIIRKNAKVCFEMDLLREIKQGPAACGWGVRYESVIGFGRAVLVENPCEKRGALDRIMDHYGACPPFSYADDIFTKTEVIRIDIESVTGKRRD
jgi:nitroimidazol reductase NimA-like FMN-containing flavoprotein (pyridoxamine 5'-phosphate oxidase superfamily)